MSDIKKIRSILRREEILSLRQGFSYVRRELRGAASRGTEYLGTRMPLNDKPDLRRALSYVGLEFEQEPTDNLKAIVFSHSRGYIVKTISGYMLKGVH